MLTRLRLPAALVALLAFTAASSYALWRHEQSAAADGSRRDARAAAAAIEERAAAALLSVQGVRAAFDSGPVDGPAFVRLARVPLARPEVVSVGWAPRVAAAERADVERAHGIRITGGDGSLFTYPLLLREPDASSPDRPDLGADPTLGTALREARGRGEAHLSPPIRLADGRVGVVAFVPVYAQGAPAATPGQRRDALRGLVVGELATEDLVAEALASVPGAGAARVTDGASVLYGRPLESAAVASATVGARRWAVSVDRSSASPVPAAAAAAAGLLLAALLAAFRRRIRSLTAAGRKLQSTLSRERTRAQQRLRAVQQRVDETERAVGLVAAATDAVVLDVDGDGVIRTCTSGSERLLGYRPDDLVGSTIYELLHPDDLLAAPTGPHRYRRRDGSFVILDTSRVLRRDALGFVTDAVTILREPEAESLLRTPGQRIADAVALEPDPVELFTIVAEEAAAELKTRSAAVVRFDDDFGTVVGVAADGPGAPLAGATLPLDETTLAGQVRAAGRPVPGAAPFRIGGRVWGALVADGADVPAVVSLAEQSQAAVAYAAAASRLAALSTRDPLTNLPDRRAFGEQLRSEVRRAVRHERALAVVLVDVDGLARLNEAHGRAAADAVLVEIARRLTAAVRQGEVVSRLAADRFAWILPETEGLNAWIAAERGRRAVSATPIPGVGTVTAAAGVCDLEAAGSAEELLGRAELALAAAKAAGGDATFRYSEELDGQAFPAEGAPRGIDRLRELADRLDEAVPGAEGHSLRVARLAEKLALASGWSAGDALRLAQAALLHDVGKLAVAEDVLERRGPLSDDDRERIALHPEAGAELVADDLDAEQAGWIRHHHERWDGTGYPARLAEDAIPAGARFLALAEAWDAMTRVRLGGGRSPLEALDECRRERGRQFAPDAVAALERLWALDAIGAEHPASVPD